MSLLTRHRVAVLLALPALLVPAIELPLVLWARFTFISLHPEYYVDPPTISRAINDPSVGGPFAHLILLITALIFAVVPVVILAYMAAISRLTLSRGQRLLMYVLLVLFLFLQLAASAGMVLTTQYTFATDGNLHMLGSYIFFVFQSLSIVSAASLCRMLLHQKRKHAIADHAWQFRAAMHRFRFRFAMLIVTLILLYGILFVLKNHVPDAMYYMVQVAYTQCEVVVIGAFVIFLGSYAVDIHHMVREDTLRLKIGRPGDNRSGAADLPAPAPVTVAKDP
jgi:hypothetical protein